MLLKLKTPAQSKLDLPRWGTEPGNNACQVTPFFLFLFFFLRKCWNAKLLLFWSSSESWRSQQTVSNSNRAPGSSRLCLSRRTLWAFQRCVWCARKKTYGGLELFTSDRICRHTCSLMVLFVLNIFVQTPCMEGLSWLFLKKHNKTKPTLQ